MLARMTPEVQLQCAVLSPVCIAPAERVRGVLTSVP